MGSPFPTKHARELLGPPIPFSSVCELPEGSTDFDIHIGNLGREMAEVHYVHSNAVVIRRSNAGATCAYPEDSRLMEDWELMIDLARQGRIAFLDRDVAIQNGHGGTRLVYVHPFEQYDARLRVLKRGWRGELGTGDPEGWARYNALVRFYRLKRGETLLGMEKLAEARADFDAAGAPLVHRLFTRLPINLALPLYRAQLSLKKRISSAFR